MPWLMHVEQHCSSQPIIHFLQLLPFTINILPHVQSPLHDLPYCHVNNDTAYKTLKCRLTSMQLVHTSLTLNVSYVIHAPEFWHDIQTLLLLYMWERNSGVVDYRLISSRINNFLWQTTDNEFSLTQVFSTLMKHLPSIMYNCVTVRYRRIGLLGACA